MSSSNNLFTIIVSTVIGLIIGTAVEGILGDFLRQLFQNAINANPESNTVPFHRLSILLIDLAPYEGLAGGGLIGYFTFVRSQNA